MSNLIVKINGSIIAGKNGQHIFENSLIKLVSICGEKAVINSDRERNCISTTNLRHQVKPKKVGKFYISTSHGNPGKASRLNKLNERLIDASLYAEVLD